MIMMIARMSVKLRISCKKSQAMIVPKIGTRDITSIPVLAPINTKDLNNRESPIVKPIIPEIPNQNK
jgi:hypothetical protein